uniref:Uncharacterized protein n=1 Tax=Arundo donax TaxID=35708 RepID=A0A0A9BGR3_ARUDO
MEITGESSTGTGAGPGISHVLPAFFFFFFLFLHAVLWISKILVIMTVFRGLGILDGLPANYAKFCGCEMSNSWNPLASRWQASMSSGKGSSTGLQPCWPDYFSR